MQPKDWIKKIPLILGSLLFVFCVMIFRPVRIPDDEKDLIAITGTVAHIYEGGEQDAAFRLEEYKGKMYYINRGLENGLDLGELKTNLLGKKITLKYSDHWTPLDPTNSINHICILEHEGQVLYSELD